MQLRYIEDYYEKVHERFPDLEMWEIEKILKHGMQTFSILNARGADIIIKSAHNSFTMYFGKLFNNKEIGYRYANLKWRIKYRLKYWLHNKVWDGNYYFVLTQEEYDKYIPKKKGRKKITLDYIKAFKIKEEACLRKDSKYLFKLTGEKDGGCVITKEHFSTRNISLIATRNSEGKMIYNE